MQYCNPGKDDVVLFHYQGDKYEVDSLAKQLMFPTEPLIIICIQTAYEQEQNHLKELMGKLPGLVEIIAQDSLDSASFDNAILKARAKEKLLESGLIHF